MRSKNAAFLGSYVIPLPSPPANGLAPLLPPPHKKWQLKTPAGCSDVRVQFRGTG